MREIAVSKFKATCLAVFQDVQKTGRPVRVTRFGKPLAEIVPAKPEPKKRPKQTDLPDGSKQINGVTGQPGYFGLGPPAGHGAHHYTFEIFALNAKLGLPASTYARIR
jgi:antitoxin (DNA-binding transcriptional repressor) of toxin-antitoxin stability system